MLVGMRMMREQDGPQVAFEYRLKDGKAILTAGDPGGAKQSVGLDDIDNAVIAVLGKEHGVRLPPFAEGAMRTYTPQDGVNFIFALLVRYMKNTGYSWTEPILA